MHLPKALACSTLLFLSLHLVGQTGYSIEYQRTNLGDTATTAVGAWPNRILLSRLVFNDTVSFFYHFTQDIRKAPSREKRKYGVNLDNHSWYFNKKQDFLAEGRHLKWVKKPFLVVDTALRFNWTLLTNTKTIDGYTCFAALSVNSKNDSTLAYYTRDIPKPFGPAWFVGLPGVILEVFDQQRGWYLKARKIEKKNVSIGLPANVEILSRDAYRSKTAADSVN